MASDPQIFGTSGNDTLTGGSVRELIYGYGGSDTLTGNGGSDNLYAFSGDDLIVGGDGNDQLNGSSGADTMIGGLGNDLYMVDSILDVVIENAGEGIDEVRSTIDYTLLDNFENLTHLGTSDWTGTGNSADNRIKGGDGNDTLNGLDGNDALTGNAGNDTLNGGNGNDWMSAGDGDDTLYGGAGADTFYGGAGNDTIIAETAEAKNYVHGGDGWDSLSFDDALTATKGVTLNLASLGVEHVTGTAQNDVLDGSGLTFAAPWGDVAVIAGGDGADTITGSAFQDYLDGGEGADKIYGGAGSDNLQGGNGADTLDGGAGIDYLTGGGGADTFVFGVGGLVVGADYQGDKVTDFQQGTDVLDISALGVAFSDLTFEVDPYANGHTYVGIDLDHNATPDVWIDLTGVFTLTAADFHI